MCSKDRCLGGIGLFVHRFDEGFELIFGRFDRFVQTNILLMAVCRLFFKVESLLFDADCDTYSDTR